MTHGETAASPIILHTYRGQNLTIFVVFFLLYMRMNASLTCAKQRSIVYEVQVPIVQVQKVRSCETRLRYKTAMARPGIVICL